MEFKEWFASLPTGTRAGLIFFFLFYCISQLVITGFATLLFSAEFMRKHPKYKRDGCIMSLTYLAFFVLSFFWVPGLVIAALCFIACGEGRTCCGVDLKAWCLGCAAGKKNPARQGEDMESGPSSYDGPTATTDTNTTCTKQPTQVDDMELPPYSSRTT